MSINRRAGICQQGFVPVYKLHEMRELLKAKGWYSGDRAYPIEHPTLLISAKEAFHQATDKWDENCPYCQRRIQIFKELGYAV